MKLMGKLTAVIFDWAGTMVDFGSRAPVATLQDVFEAAGVPVTVAEARERMGVAKRDHIRAILGIPRVAEGWTAARGAAPTEEDLDALYADFLPKQTERLGAHSGLIAGVAEMAEELRRAGIRIGSTTGYTRPMLDFLVERARAQGFAPDCSLCPDDVPGGGRPAPWMCYLNAIRLQAGPMWTMVKVGDTPSDIEEGLNAGMWTVGVTRTGNEVGMTEEEWEAASADEREGAVARAGGRLRAAGAHYIAGSVAESRGAIERIAARVASGERP